MFLVCLAACLALVLNEARPGLPTLQAQQTTSSNQSQTKSADIAALQVKAEAGDPVAQLELGKAYEKGIGVAQNDTLAVAWYKKAADQGNAAAEDSLGVMYRLGQGVEKNKEEAVGWYRKAAKQGSAEAMFNLGASYYNGDGVPEDPILACAWFFLAQNAGNKPADDAVERSVTELGRGLTSDAMMKVGELYENGAELPKSYPEAAKWYRKAAIDSPEAAIRLATLLIRGQELKQDYAEALDLCRTAGTKGYPPGNYCVGYVYQHGLGVAADAKAAVKWYREAQLQGHAGAALALANMYQNGQGVDVDRPEAYRLLVSAYLRGAKEAKPQAYLLRTQMDQKENKRLQKKLREAGYDPKKVFELIDDPNPPDPANARRQLPPVIRYNH